MKYRHSEAIDTGGRRKMRYKGLEEARHTTDSHSTLCEFPEHSTTTKSLESTSSHAGLTQP